MEMVWRWYGDGMETLWSRTRLRFSQCPFSSYAKLPDLLTCGDFYASSHQSGGYLG